MFPQNFGPSLDYITHSYRTCCLPAPGVSIPIWRYVLLFRTHKHGPWRILSVTQPHDMKKPFRENYVMTAYFSLANSAMSAN